jgi:ABC-2 type transport system ATP-binding protein
MEFAVETHGLTRAFGETVAVDHVDLAVPAGASYGFLGPNGAGKSTTIKCLTGLLRPDAGTVRILDLDPSSHALELKRQVGVIPEDEAIFERLTGAETLTLVAQGAINDVTAGRTLEDAFVAAVGGQPDSTRTLEWLG